MILWKFLNLVLDFGLRDAESYRCKGCLGLVFLSLALPTELEPLPIRRGAVEILTRLSRWSVLVS